MEEAKELASSSLSQGLNHHGSDPDDIPKSPPGSPNSSTRKVTLTLIQQHSYTHSHRINPQILN